MCFYVIVYTIFLSKYLREFTITVKTFLLPISSRAGELKISGKISYLFLFLSQLLTELCLFYEISKKDN